VGGGIRTARQDAIAPHDGERYPVGLAFARVHRDARPPARLVVANRERGALAQEAIDGLREQVRLGERQRGHPPGAPRGGEQHQRGGPVGIEPGGELAVARQRIEAELLCHRATRVAEPLATVPLSITMMLGYIRKASLTYPSPDSMSPYWTPIFLPMVLSPPPVSDGPSGPISCLNCLSSSQARIFSASSSIFILCVSTLESAMSIRASLTAVVSSILCNISSWVASI